MTNNLAQVTRMAEECGAKPMHEVTIRDGRKVCAINFLPEELLAYTQKVEQTMLAKRDEEIKSQITLLENIAQDRRECLAYKIEEIESLQAKLAMLREIARDAEMWYSRDTMLGKELRMQAHNALNATQADVDNWMQGKKAEWESETRSMYHELLYAVCAKYPNETRHQTALRYIRRMEEPVNTGCASKNVEV